MGKPPECFFEFSDAQVARLETAGQIRTAIRYKGVVKKLRDYRKGKSFTFDDFTVSFLHDYESHLMSIGNSTNTIHTNIKTLRAILYKAIREDRFEQGKNPFFKFKLKKAPTSKERLTLEEINRMKTVDLNPNHMIYHARNAFLFSFYCAGIRIGDILQMRWVNIDNDYLSYKMSKTGQFRKVKMVKQARSILDIYKQTKTEDSIFIFPFLSNLEELNDPDRLYRRLSSLTAMINLRLKKIALLADIDKKLSSHIARHSFADIARKKGMKIYDISKALGHTSLAIAEKYLSGFDDDALEGAIERIFD